MTNLTEHHAARLIPKALVFSAIYDYRPAADLEPSRCDRRDNFPPHVREVYGRHLDRGIYAVDHARRNCQSEYPAVTVNLQDDKDVGVTNERVNKHPGKRLWQKV